MAPTSMATTTTKTNAVLLLLALLLLLPLGALASHSGSGSGSVPHQGHAPSNNNKRHPPPSPAPASPQPPPTPELVRSTCNSTSYYDLCVSALGADPSSATADVRGLSAIAVSAAAANASGAAAALANGTASAQQQQQQAGPSSAAADGVLLRACAGKYEQARDALGAARGSIAQQDYDFAAVHVGAAAEYPQVCRALFRRQRPGQYPAELAAREEALKQLCSVALDIIALLSSSSAAASNN